MSVHKFPWIMLLQDSGCPDEFDYSVDYDTDIFYKLVDGNLSISATSNELNPILTTPYQKV